MEIVPEGFSPSSWREGFDHTVGPLYSRREADGTEVMGFRVDRRHINGREGCHGGMLAGFADVAWGQPLRGRYGGWATVRLTTDFLSSTGIGSWIEGSSVVLTEQDDVFTLRGRIWCGERLARASITAPRLAGRSGSPSRP